MRTNEPPQGGRIPGVDETWLNWWIKAYERLLALHSKEWDDAQFVSYAQLLSRYPVADLSAGLTKLTAQSKWFPKPAEIIEAMEGSLEAQAAAEWARVRPLIGSVGRYSPVDLGDCSNAAIKSVGGWSTVCQSSVDRLDFLGMGFRKAWKEYRQGGVPEELAKPLTGLHRGEVVSKLPPGHPPREDKALGGGQHKQIADVIRKAMGGNRDDDNR